MEYLLALVGILVTPNKTVNNSKLFEMQGKRGEMISQRELKRVAKMQAAESIVADEVHSAAAELSNRLQRGATVEAGPLVFDASLCVVRTEKAG